MVQISPSEIKSVESVANTASLPPQSTTQSGGKLNFSRNSIRKVPMGAKEWNSFGSFLA